MMDPEALAIPDVQLIVDSTKAEVINYFKTIEQKAEKITREEGCRVGIFIFSIGFQWSETFQGIHKSFSLTCQGEPVSIV